MDEEFRRTEVSWRPSFFASRSSVFSKSRDSKFDDDAQGSHTAPPPPSPTAPPPRAAMRRKSAAALCHRSPRRDGALLNRCRSPPVVADMVTLIFSACCEFSKPPSVARIAHCDLGGEISSKSSEFATLLLQTFMGELNSKI